MAKNLDLQSAHYEQAQATAQTDLPAGDLVTLNSGVNGFPVVNVLDTEDYCVITKAEKVKAVKATGAISVGVPVYWDDTAKNVTTTAGGNILIGFAYEAAASADTHVNINFDGFAAFLKA